MLSLLDTRTLLFIITLTLLSRGIVLVYVWHVEKQYPPVKYWTLGSILIAAGALLVGLRDVISLALSIALGQSLVLSGWLLINGGIVIAAERRPPWRLGAVIAAAAIMLIIWFAWVTPDFLYRTLVATLAQTMFDFYAAFACLRFGPGRIRTTLRILAVCLIAVACSNLWKIVGIAIQDIHSLTQPNTPIGQFLLISSIFCTVETILFVLLASQRQQEALDLEIKERIRREEALKLAAMVYENSLEGMLITDVDGNIITVNPAFTQLTGYLPEEAIGKTPRLLKSGRESDAFYEMMWSSLEKTGKWSGEIQNLTKQGELRTEWLSINTIHDAAGAPHLRVALYHDVTEQKKSAELVYHQANYDRLTGLPNRYFFFDHLSKEISRARRNGGRVALFFMDLNRFKPINDRFGHEAGDFVLKVVAERWSHCCRGSDTLARLGGDEFALIAGGVNEREEAQAIATKLIQSLHPAITLPTGQSCHVGTSVGIALFPDNAMEMDSLVKAADEAMYVSKSSGHDQFAFSTQLALPSSESHTWLQLETKHLVGIREIDDQHRQLVSMVNDLNRAIRNDCSEEEFKSLFSGLISYTAMHFATERGLMEQYQYPGLDSHERHHDDLLKEIRQLSEQLDGGNELRLLQTVKDWLLNHVLFEDKPLAEFLIDRGVQ